MDIIGMLPTSLQNGVYIIFYVFIMFPLAVWALYKKIGPQRVTSEGEMSRYNDQMLEFFRETVEVLRDMKNSLDGVLAICNRLDRDAELEKARAEGRNEAQLKQLRESRSRVSSIDREPPSHR